MLEKLLIYLLRSESEKRFRSQAKSVKIGIGFVAQISETAKLQFGKNLDFRNYISIWVGKNAELKMGENVFMNNFCSVNCLKSIEIGENTIFGEGVKVYDHNHAYSHGNGELNVNRKEFTYGAVKIGKNCWLGSNSVVLKGVSIGDNSIIGAGCVIHKDVPANSVIVNKQELILKNQLK